MQPLRVHDGSPLPLDQQLRRFLDHQALCAIPVLRYLPLLLHDFRVLLARLASQDVPLQHHGINTQLDHKACVADVFLARGRQDHVPQ